MALATQIYPAQAQKKVATGNALLVCGYEDEGRCARIRLQGSMSLNEFKGQMSTLARDQEIIFYCTAADQGVAERLARQYQQQGYEKAMFLAGGAENWTRGGHGLSTEAR